MAMRRTTTSGSVAWCVTTITATVVMAVPGCSKGGLSDYSRKELARQQLSESLEGQGVKIAKRNFAQIGDAWAIGMSGLTVTDEMLVRIQKMGNITELDLSKSTITDAQMEHVREIGGRYLNKLDLSHTAVTDAGMEKLIGGMHFLGNLNLTGTKVTPAAVERFKKTRLDDKTILPMFQKPTIQQ